MLIDPRPDDSSRFKDVLTGIRAGINNYPRLFVIAIRVNDRLTPSPPFDPLTLRACRCSPPAS
ncbi:hypothetical protein [Streptomyces oceani]|uniref:hypothetical protein n=1 Tax=Streptomyces oceani TaxID=1075402 RepID=UPI00147D2068|nr:hypothetical protein [Streptomyces oceani]